MGRVTCAYRYRYYPTDEQQQMLARTFGCARWIYNWALAHKSRAYREEGKRLFYEDLSACLPVLKQQKETAWLAQVSSVPLQQSLRHLERAFVNYFEGRANYPCFKSKKRNVQSATYTPAAFTYRDGVLTLAKMGEPLNIRWSRPLPQGAIPSRVTVSRDSAGRYFVSLLVEEEIEPLPHSSEQIGIDLGLTSMVTTSRGDKAGNPVSLRVTRRSWPGRRNASPEKDDTRRTARRPAARWPGFTHASLTAAGTTNTSSRPA